MIRLIDKRVMEKLRDKPENVDWEEFVPLVGEWREDKASTARCPYCVEPIQKQATKCSHCLSEIEWFKFDGLYGPCKAGASEEMEAALVMAKAAVDPKEETKLQERINKIRMARCVSCFDPLLTIDEVKELEDDPHCVSILEKRHRSRITFDYYCTSCKPDHDKYIRWVLIVVASFFLALLLLYIFAFYLAK